MILPFHIIKKLFIQNNLVIEQNILITDVFPICFRDLNENSLIKDDKLCQEMNKFKNKIKENMNMK